MKKKIIITRNILAYQKLAVFFYQYNYRLVDL